MRAQRAVLFLAFLGLLPACGDKGQLVLGIATDLLARGQLDRVELEVRRTGETDPVVQFGWELAGVPAEDYRLPGSFNLYAEGGQEPTFEVMVRGKLRGTEKLVRRSRLGIVSDEALFIRLGLVGKCEDIGCPATMTCVEGQCQPPVVDIRRLPAFRSELVERIDCDSGTVYRDTGTGQPMPAGTSCSSGSVCGEGTCLVDPAMLPPADPRPLIGGPAELFSAGAARPDFYAVGPLDAARYFATATPLVDGRVLVVGGFDRAAVDAGAQPVPGAAIYDPASAQFTRLDDPPVALAGHTATRLTDGSVVLVGSSSPGQAAALLFDPASNRFSALPAPPQARYFHSTSLLRNGKLLVVGGTAGFVSSAALVGGAQLYDPVSRTWTNTKVGPVRTRAFHATALIDDGRVLLLGGVDGAGMATASVEAYDPTIDEFRDEASMSSPRVFHTATVLGDKNTVLVVGGTSFDGLALEQTELYVPMGYTPPSQPSPPAPLPRVFLQAVPLAGDRVLFVGGAAQVQPLAAAGGAFLYDRASNTFSVLPEPKTGRLFAFAAALPDGDVLIGGGNAAIAPGNDGGVDLSVPVDFSPPPDMTFFCDPTVATDGGCGAGFACRVRGQALYPMRYVSVAGPYCVSLGTQPLYHLGDVCTPGSVAGSDFDDGCEAGTVCMVDENGVGTATCRKLCHADSECPTMIPDGGFAARTVCAQVMSGPGLAGVGFCSYPCNVFNSEDCMLTGGGMCRYAPHQAVATGPIEGTGICMPQGGVPVGQPCAQTNLQDECSYNEACIGGFCHYLCDDQVRCDQNFGGTCTGIAPGTPTTFGYCSPNPDMAQPAAGPPPDMSMPDMDMSMPDLSMLDLDMTLPA